jgi:hypothetical protein
MGRVYTRNCFYLNKRDPKGLLNLIIISRIPAKMIDDHLSLKNKELALYMRGDRRISPDKYLAYLKATREMMRTALNKNDCLPLPPSPRYICEDCGKGTYSRRSQGEEGPMKCSKCYKGDFYR